VSRGAVAGLAVAMCMVGSLWVLWTQPPLLITAGVLLGSLMLLALSLVGLVVSRR